MSILASLYHEWYEMKSGFRPEEREVQRRFDRAWEQSEALLPKELAEELRSSIFILMNEESCYDFQAGIRFGAQLMLELQAPVFPCRSKEMSR